MYRPFLIAILLFCMLWANAQPLTSEKLEARWKVLYQQAYEAREAVDFAAAEQSLKASIELLLENEAANTSSHVYSLIRLGELYHITGAKTQLKAIDQTLQEMGASFRPGSKRQADYLYNLGVYYSDTQRFPEALSLLEQALSCTEALDRMPGGESRVLHRMGLCHYFSGNMDKAVSFARRCVSTDDNHTPDYIQALAYYYSRSAAWGELEELIPKCFEYSREPILRQFSQSAGQDRAQYWSKAGLFFTSFLPSYADEHSSDALVSSTYDAALLSKGILLAAENKMIQLARQSSDPDFARSFERMQELKGRKDRSLDEDFELEALSKSVLRRQKEHKNEYRGDFRIGWKDVRDRLGADDVAIEFITYPDSDASDAYAALVLKKKYAAPKFVKLPHFDQLANASARNPYTNPALYNLVWKPLESELSDIRRIYFSPAGIFYNTGIEYLPDEDGTPICLSKDVFRLSSTKELVLTTEKPIKTGVLFGGIDYDTKVSVMAGQSPRYDAESASAKGAPLDSLDLRSASKKGGFAFLDGTMEEVGDISLILMEAEISSDLYAGEEASETCFKGLTGSGVQLLHIATHGFYYYDRHVGHNDSVDRLFLEMSLHLGGDGIETVEEDRMLTHSGLIFAGANNAIKRIPLPEGIEDGILYASEIAHLNLSQVGLVVLSACQSGLGDIVSSEGVFGLQRAFKMAGAGSIVMSLWKVNDEATRILMTALYQNLTEGKGRRQALTEAQLVLRTYEGGIFDAPEYWAAFVVSDALN